MAETADSGIKRILIGCAPLKHRTRDAEYEHCGKNERGIFTAQALDKFYDYEHVVLYAYKGAYGANIGRHSAGGEKTGKTLYSWRRVEPELIGIEEEGDLKTKVFPDVFERAGKLGDDGEIHMDITHAQMLVQLEMISAALLYKQIWRGGMPELKLMYAEENGDNRYRIIEIGDFAEFSNAMANIYAAIEDVNPRPLEKAMEKLNVLGKGYVGDKRRMEDYVKIKEIVNAPLGELKNILENASIGDARRRVAPEKRQGGLPGIISLMAEGIYGVYSKELMVDRYYGLLEYLVEKKANEPVAWAIARECYKMSAYLQISGEKDLPTGEKESKSARRNAEIEERSFSQLDEKMRPPEILGQLEDIRNMFQHVYAFNPAKTGNSANSWKKLKKITKKRMHKEISSSREKLKGMGKRAGKVVMANAISPKMFFKRKNLDIRMTAISLENAELRIKNAMAQGNFQSFIGHHATASVISRKFGLSIPYHRGDYEFEAGDTLIVASFGAAREKDAGNLPEEELVKRELTLFEIIEAPSE